jgi:hypothetical protein
MVDPKWQPWIKYIVEGKIYLDILPANYNLAYDKTCNLKCPSCRSDSIVVMFSPQMWDRINEIHDRLP